MEFDKVSGNRNKSIFISIIIKDEFSKKSNNKKFQFQYQTLTNWTKTNGKYEYSNILKILRGLEIKFNNHLISYSPYTDLENLKGEEDLKEILKKENFDFFSFLCYNNEAQFKLIYSLTDYVKNIQDKQLLLSIKNNLFFRGQCLKWAILPSLFREKEWVSSEAKLNEIVISDRPNDFNDCKTPFENLVRLKHYDQPSRLLDLTSSPLNALFFACDSGVKNSEPGIVYYSFSKKDEEKYSSISDTVTMLTAITKTVNKCSECEIKPCPIKGEPIGECKLIPEIRYQVKKLSSSDNWDDLTLDKLDQCIIVRPPMNTNRIVQQHGLFVMCGRNNIDYNLSPVSLENFFMDNGSVSGVVVPSFLNKAILNELDRFGVNEYYIYGDLEKKIKVEKARVLPKPSLTKHNKITHNSEFESYSPIKVLNKTNDNLNDEERTIFLTFVNELYNCLGKINQNSKFHNNYFDMFKALTSIYRNNKLFDEISSENILGGIIKNDIFSYYQSHSVKKQSLCAFLKAFDTKSISLEKADIIYNNIKSKLQSKFKYESSDDDIPF